MKIQWNTITPFARKVLRKLGAVSIHELNEERAAFNHVIRDFWERAKQYESNYHPRLVGETSMEMGFDMPGRYVIVRIVPESIYFRAERAELDLMSSSLIRDVMRRRVVSAYAELGARVFDKYYEHEKF